MEAQEKENEWINCFMNIPDEEFIKAELYNDYKLQKQSQNESQRFLSNDNNFTSLPTIRIIVF